MMAGLSKKEKEQIKLLPKKDLETIVFKLAAKKENYHYLLVNYLDKESGEQELFQEVIANIDKLCTIRYEGFSEQLQITNLIAACVNRINEFSKVSNKKNLEADLMLYVLEIPFSYHSGMFGTCFTQFDYKTGLLLKRLITLVTKKLHEDYVEDYSVIINEYLNRLHSTSDHLDSIYDLPKSV